MCGAGDARSPTRLTKRPPARSLSGLPLLLAALWGSSFLFMRWPATDFGALPTAAPAGGHRGAVPAAHPAVARPRARRCGRTGGPRCLPDRRAQFGGCRSRCSPLRCCHISTGLAAILNATVPLFGALMAWAG
jgi:hypothetical protein